MNAQQKHQLLEKLCLDAHWLDTICGNNRTGPLPSTNDMRNIQDRIDCVNKSAAAFFKAMNEKEVERGSVQV